MMPANDERINTVNDGLRLIEKTDGLTFGSDAYLLSAYVRRQPKAIAADLGSGTGILALLLLKRDKLASVTAYEVQPEFAELAARNAALNQLSDRMTAVCADVRSLMPASLDVVVSNPPYMKADGGRLNDASRKTVARHEILGGIDDFCAAASRLLKHGGLFYTVYRPDRMSELFSALAAHQLEPKRLTLCHARAELPACFLLCEAKKGAAPGLYTTPPLILYEHEAVPTPTLAAIYERGDFDVRFQRP